MNEEGGKGEGIRVPDWYLRNIEGREGHPNRMVVRPDLILNFPPPDLERTGEALRELDETSGSELKDNIQEHFGAVLDAQAAELREMQIKFDSEQSPEYRIAKAAAEAADVYLYDVPENRQKNEVRVTVVERDGKFVTIFNSSQKEGTTYDYNRDSVGIDYANTHYYDLQAIKIDGPGGVKEKLKELRSGMDSNTKLFLLRYLADPETHSGLAIRFVQKLGREAANAPEIRILKAFYEKIKETGTKEDSALAREQTITGGAVDTQKLQARRPSPN